MKCFSQGWFCLDNDLCSLCVSLYSGVRWYQVYYTRYIMSTWQTYFLFFLSSPKCLSSTTTEIENEQINNKQRKAQIKAKDEEQKWKFQNTTAWWCAMVWLQNQNEIKYRLNETLNEGFENVQWINGPVLVAVLCDAVLLYSNTLLVLCSVLHWQPSFNASSSLVVTTTVW